jgi:CheY-like chemotaxis protein
MHQVRLIHWNAAEAEERAARLRLAGYDVDACPFDRASLRAMREHPPDAVVIDLGRLPSQGRDVAMTLRKYATTRHTPLVFVGGPEDKVGRIRALLPDATYTAWDRIGDDLARAIAAPPEEPIVPDSPFDAYKGTPLPVKLGIAENAVVALVGAPDDFEGTLGDLPAGVVTHREPTDESDVTLWFVRSREELERDVARMGAYAGKGGLWIVWPKKASGVRSDLSQNVVRQTGLASGLVDFKICSVDATWSGLRFTRRKPQ